MTDTRDEFSVYTFDANGLWTRELSFVSAERAMNEAAAWASMADRQIARIIITDGGDHTVFEWRFGEGVVFPPASQR